MGAIFNNRFSRKNNEMYMVRIWTQLLCPYYIATERLYSTKEGGVCMARTVRVKVTTNVRHIGNGRYQIRTTTSNGSSTKTTTKTIRTH